MIRFHLDERVEAAVARALRDRGIDVTTATEAHSSGGIVRALVLIYECPTEQDMIGHVEWL